MHRIAYGYRHTQQMLFIITFGLFNEVIGFNV